MRQQLVAFLRTGMKRAEAARAIGVSEALVKREEQIDPDFHAQVQEAMLTAFNPILKKALELAQHADSEGENVGAHSAMKLVFSYYEKVMDREHAADQVDKKIMADMMKDQRPVQHQTFVLMPEAVPGFMDAIAGKRQPVAEIEEGEVVEDDDA